MDRRKSLYLLGRLGLGILLTVVSGCTRNGIAKKRNRRLAIGNPEQFDQSITPLALERIAIIKDAAGFAAVSMVCTHMPCALQFRTKRFECPCHGSVFSLNGAVLNGPAKDALSFFKITQNEEGALVVHFDEVVPSDQRYLPAMSATSTVTAVL